MKKVSRTSLQFPKWTNSAFELIESLSVAARIDASNEKILESISNLNKINGITLRTIQKSKKDKKGIRPSVGSFGFGYSPLNSPDRTKKINYDTNEHIGLCKRRSLEVPQNSHSRKQSLKATRKSIVDEKIMRRKSQIGRISEIEGFNKLFCVVNNANKSRKNFKLKGNSEQAQFEYFGNKANKISNNTRVQIYIDKIVNGKIKQSAKEYKECLKQIGKSTPTVFLVPDINQINGVENPLNINLMNKFKRTSSAPRYSNRHDLADDHQDQSFLSKNSKTKKQTSPAKSKRSRKYLSSTITSSVNNIKEKLLLNVEDIKILKIRRPKKFRELNSDEEEEQEAKKDIVKEGIISSRIENIKHRDFSEKLKQENMLITKLSEKMAYQYRKQFMKGILFENNSCFKPIEVLSKEEVKKTNAKLNMISENIDHLNKIKNQRVAIIKSVSKNR